MNRPLSGLNVLSTCLLIVEIFVHDAHVIDIHFEVQSRSRHHACIIHT